MVRTCYAAELECELFGNDKPREPESIVKALNKGLLEYCGFVIPGLSKCLSELTDALRWLLFIFPLESCSGETTTTSPIYRLTFMYMASLAYPGTGGLGLGASSVLIAKHLHALSAVSRIKHCLDIDNQLPFPCSSVYDLYTNLLGHFSAVSYNAPILANLVLWSCQQTCHFKYRRALWGEYQKALSSVRLRHDQLIIPMTGFLEPEETEPSVLRLYASALLSGIVREACQPVLFLIAVHHLNRYLYNTQNITSELIRQLSHFGRSITKAGLHKIVARQNVLLVLRSYKQPTQYVMDRKNQLPSLLSDEELLKAGLDGPLIRGDSNATDGKTALFECYSDETLPANRKAYWEKHFN